ncbi:MAG TPA: alpha/beta family hydrolase [Micromonosporaceae bacterium]
MRTRKRTVDTPRGPARVSVVAPAGRPVAMLALGHGAGGDVDTPDVVTVRDAAVAAGLTVASVTQPYRVAGRRSPAPAAQLDEAWTAVVNIVYAEAGGSPLPLLLGGRSSGARVACRTAHALGAAGLVALAFPLHPPGKPERSRADELKTGVPTLVVNGDRDPFGVPSAGPGIDLVVRPGEGHGLRRDPGAVATAVVDWLRRHGWAR